MSLDPDAQRRLHAKRANERIKLLYSTANALAIGVLGAAIIVPGVTSLASLMELQRAIWFLVAVGLHCTGLAIVGLLRSED